MHTVLTQAAVHSFNATAGGPVDQPADICTVLSVILILPVGIGFTCKRLYRDVPFIYIKVNNLAVG